MSTQFTCVDVRTYGTFGTMNNFTANNKAARYNLTISCVVSAHDAADGDILGGGASLQVEQRIVLVRHAEPIREKKV